MIETFGARLRRRREEQNIALAAIAERTKIKTSLLEALERDDVSHWPTGIFGRGFIRSYAEAIHVDPDASVREFLSLHPDPTPPAHEGDADGKATGTGHGGTRFATLMAALGSLRRRWSPADGGTGANVTFVQPAPRVAAGELDVHPKFGALAHVCTELGCAATVDDAQASLGEAADLLDATGVIVWQWNEEVAALKPRLAYGYSQKVLQQIPAVAADANNATAAAFRSARPQIMHSNGSGRGALVVPLMARGGCAGVLAIELRHGCEETTTARAAATILAALLAPLIMLR